MCYLKSLDNLTDSVTKLNIVTQQHQLTCVCQLFVIIELVTCFPLIFSLYETECHFEYIIVKSTAKYNVCQLINKQINLQTIFTSDHDT